MEGGSFFSKIEYFLVFGFLDLTFLQVLGKVKCIPTPKSWGNSEAHQWKKVTEIVSRRLTQSLCFLWMSELPERTWLSRWMLGVALHSSYTIINILWLWRLSCVASSGVVRVQFRVYWHVWLQPKWLWHFCTSFFLFFLPTLLFSSSFLHSRKCRSFKECFCFNSSKATSSLLDCTGQIQ